MGYTDILYEKGSGAARITINRPEVYNALRGKTTDEMVDALEDAGSDESVRVVVIAGSGPNAFCSGRDQGEDRSSPEYSGTSESSFMELVRRIPKPVIAMVNGAAVGAGFDMASVCDLRVGSSNARFMVAYVRIGLFPGYGGAWLYPRALGSIPKAAELLFTGDFMEAEEAHRYGFLNKLVAPEELEEATLEMARKIANGPPIAIRLAKMMLYRGLEFDLETSLKMAAAAETITLTSEDHKEGIAAFREKRRPAFRGR